MASGNSMKCERLRREGNMLYFQVSEGGFCLSMKRIKLVRARELYTEALHESLNSDERASCCKNLGALNWLWSKVELEPVLGEEPSEPQDTARLALCKDHLSKAVSFVLKAKNHGIRAGKAQEWLEKLESFLIEIVDWAAEQSRILSLPYAPILRSLCESFDDTSSNAKTEAAVIANKHFAQALFNQGILKLFNGEEPQKFRDCLEMMFHCDQPLRKAEGFLAGHGSQLNEELLHQVQDLQKEVWLHQCICKSRQALVLGDAAFKNALEEEELSMDLVFDALDHYREAVLLTRELDIESEAMAMSRIGKVYSEVFKDQQKAHPYHFQAIRLALTIMSPKIAESDWYIYSLAKVKMHQERVVADENEERNKSREPYLKRLEGKLKDLSKEAEKSAESFLRYVYEKHIHPDPKRMLGSLGTKEETKASLRKALVHYHPDSNGQYGEEWKVLSEEITKHLNIKYEYYK